MARTKAKLTPESLLAKDKLTNGYDRLPVWELNEVHQRSRAEFKKRQPRLARRIGQVAVDGLAVLTFAAAEAPGILRQLPAAHREYVGAEPKSNDFAPTAPRKRRVVRDFLSNVAMNRFDSRKQRYAERARLRNQTHLEVTDKYREEHPELVAHEAKLRTKAQAEFQAQREYWAFSKVAQDGEYATKYLKGKTVSSFTKAIPRRSTETTPGFDGEYQTLAKDSLTSALERKQDDGTIPLLSSKLLGQRWLEKQAAGKSVDAVFQSESAYVDGVSTAMWQLGFVNLEEEGIPYGRGTLNESVQWGQTDSGATTARLGFDPQNELHTMLMGESSFANPVIELEMQERNDWSHQSAYLNLRVVDAASTALAA